MAKNDRQFIRWLQTQLNRHGANLKVDGIAGPRTREALRAFQQQMGVSISGTATEPTIAALRKAPQAGRAQVPSPRPSPARSQPVSPAGHRTGSAADIRARMEALGTTGPELEQVMADYERLQAQRPQPGQFRPPVGNFPSARPSPMGVSVPAGARPAGMPPMPPPGNPSMAQAAPPQPYTPSPGKQVDDIIRQRMEQEKAGPLPPAQMDLFNMILRGLIDASKRQQTQQAI